MKEISYKPTIGLEIHVELKTKSKMFCPCKNDSTEKRANFNICPICMGHPGTLPVPNEEAIKKVIKAGIALNCKISKESKFDRKNYFYPDLPKGYQISQYDMPLCQNGFLNIGERKIKIRRIHIEEDTGRLLHSEKGDYSLIDFNRAGIPLMELVTEPDIKSGKEARKFAEELQLILKYLDVSNADMEKGEMRVEVNISLSKDLKNLGTKVEIKNLNSFKVVEKAVDFEIERQKEILERGEKIIQETRGWHDKKEITFSQREKEEAHDYRYFPDPDLPKMYFTDNYINKIKQEIPELPSLKRERFKKQFYLDENAIEFFVINKDLGEYYEKVVSEFEEWMKAEKIEIEKEKNKIYKLIANYLISDIKGLLKGKEFIEKDFKITPENFAEFIKMIYKNEITSKIAKIVLEEMFLKGKDPSNIIEEKGLSQIKNANEIEEIVKEVILKNKKAVEDFKKGKKEAIQFLVGQTLSITKGRANPETAREIILKLLKEEK
ncbi:MAG TPA: Asp-tRNA(Asn)/Glu-tRNA(Gln) amidotransferase subunit GatB [Candidatus Pacearchaeota archaeon]|nr:Asp-tRNA(Asn)/Glu-tRNA(Gln) amidotransferase subunit GatB [Candidatus Pacearchaeota archaeon]